MIYFTVINIKAINILSEQLQCVPLLSSVAGLYAVAIILYSITPIKSEFYLAQS